MKVSNKNRKKFNNEELFSSVGTFEPNALMDMEVTSFCLSKKEIILWLVQGIVVGLTVLAALYIFIK